MSPVEKPIVEIFHSFYALMSGMEDIICIAENKEYYKEWASLAKASCSLETLEQRSIVGVQLSHINATVQSTSPLGNSYRNLPVSSKGVCVLNTPDEEKMHSLEILCVMNAVIKNLHLLAKKEVRDLEGMFYRGGKISWKHLSGLQNRKCVEILLSVMHVTKSRIFYTGFISQHAVKLREYEGNDPNLCLPVLLLVEDCEEDYLDDLRHELMEAMAVKKIVYSKPCFILMSCKRSNVPEDFFKASASDTVVITHKLSQKEKQEFSTKVTELEKKFPKEEFIITFVLMSREFDEQYVKDFVQNVLRGIDHASDITRLLRYVALLNCYVQNSYISVFTL
ncbi:unnamed protein product [Ranitomeya imitator]|uniref:Uncharacterized protein n=1 Tax=Ranitomeya imitator TaxID=111125 RepID=A0ABN9MMD5_9NEOB|nr:unnamed protein product [Ranitomeya imitator]